jgi:hypothetical protein
MADKLGRSERWAHRKAKHRKAKHRKDHDHGKGGFVGGNVRYDRRHADEVGNRTMARARASSWF